MIEPNSQEGEIFPVSKLDKFYVDLTPLSDINLMAWSEFRFEQQIFLNLGEGIFDESRGNLKDSLSPRFSLSHNLEI